LAAFLFAPGAEEIFMPKKVDLDVQDKLPQPRFVMKNELCARVGLTFPSIWAKMRRGEFPLPRDLGGRPGWLDSEVSKWIRSQPVRHYKPLDAKQSASA
jgi:predicted DNA-binding transcriptional regulator AlpA